MVSTHSRPKAAVCKVFPNILACDVSTHSRPKAAEKIQVLKIRLTLFQHTAARRRLLAWIILPVLQALFQHTAARRRLPFISLPNLTIQYVSTHSRPKAAGNLGSHAEWLEGFQHTAARRRLRQTGRNSHLTHGFNTQPPEGGWQGRYSKKLTLSSFNTQPPEGG